jgi:hypothetical protein
MFSGVRTRVIGRENCAVFAFKPTHSGGADHAGVTCDVNALTRKIK